MYKNRISIIKSTLTLFLAAILSGQLMNAQTGIQASFVQTGTKSGKVVNGEGTIYYAAPSSLALRASLPSKGSFQYLCQESILSC